MKLKNIQVLLTSTLLLLPLLVNAEEKIPSQELQQARTLVKAFGSDLKIVLKTAMQTQGPVKAVQACNSQAGPIADKISALSAWDIARTSLKVRNNNNTADEWESSVLRQFERRKTAGEDLKTLEYFETVKQGEHLVYRYMKAIPTAGLCLTCHGGNIGEEISNKVNSLYPNDQAIGFTVGDIRGAFTLQKRDN